MSLFNAIRSAAAEVAGKARDVHIDYERLSEYAASLAHELYERTSDDDPAHTYPGDTEGCIAYILTLDSINFGSGYFPHLRKRPGCSGYFTIASALRDHFISRGILSAQALVDLKVNDCFILCEQEPGSQPVTELMSLYATALNDLGRFLLDHYDGSFIAVVDAADQSAERLVRSLSRMPLFRDVQDYHGFEVPFYKRAQLTVYDLSIALDGRDRGLFTDLDNLTVFADNMIPHVLRTDGVLHYSDHLSNRIERGELIPAGSSEEIEIRACAVHASELLVKALHHRGQQITSSRLDHHLWHRGRHPRYKNLPRHRTRTTYY